MIKVSKYFTLWNAVVMDGNAVMDLYWKLSDGKLPRTDDVTGTIARKCIYCWPTLFGLFWI